MSNNATTKSCKKPSKKRSVSFHDTINKIPTTPSGKENVDSKDINLEIKSTTSSQKRGHHYKHAKRKTINKSSLKNNASKKVSFKEEFIEVVNIENWKMYNIDKNDNAVDSKKDPRNKDKTTCACVLL